LRSLLDDVAPLTRFFTVGLVCEGEYQGSAAVLLWLGNNPTCAEEHR